MPFLEPLLEKQLNEDKTATFIDFAKQAGFLISFSVIATLKAEEIERILRTKLKERGLILERGKEGVEIERTFTSQRYSGEEILQTGFSFLGGYSRNRVHCWVSKEPRRTQIFEIKPDGVKYRVILGNSLEYMDQSLNRILGRPLADILRRDFYLHTPMNFFERFRKGFEFQYNWTHQEHEYETSRWAIKQILRGEPELTENAHQIVNDYYHIRELQECALRFLKRRKRQN